MANTFMNVCIVLCTCNIHTYIHFSFLEIPSNLAIVNERCETKKSQRYFSDLNIHRRVLITTKRKRKAIIRIEE